MCENKAGLAYSDSLGLRTCSSASHSTRGQDNLPRPSANLSMRNSLSK